jgi:hypothetical protein
LSSGYPDNKVKAPISHLVEATTASPASPVHAVAGRNYNVEEAVECLLHQFSDVKEGRKVTLII